MRNATLAFSCFFVTIFATSARAQLNLGSIAGAVTDPNGAVIVDCQLTAAGTGGDAFRTVHTNSQGLFNISSLPAGEYRVAAEAPGFQKLSTVVTVVVDRVTTADLHLTIGNVTEQVEVSAQSSLVDVERDTHEISHTIQTKDLRDLPTAGRSFISLATLGTGSQRATDAFISAGGPAANFGSVGHEVILAGQFVGSTTFLQDGVINVNLLTQTANIVPSIESIQEVSVESSGMSARFAAPGVVNVITRRGGNAFHGTVYDYLENDALNARSFFSATKPQLRYNQFGGNLGAPIIHDKLFAFFDYAGQRQTNYSVARARVPTPDERAGNFATSTVTVYDPSTYNAVTGAISTFPGGVIPTNRVSPFAQKYMAYFPAPNQPLVNGINYQTNLRNTTNYDQYLGRMDYNLSPSNSLYGSILTSESPVVNPSISSSLFGIIYQMSGRNAFLQDVHILTPNLLNTARLGYNRSILVLSQQGVGAENYVADFGLKNLNLAKDNSIPPSASISGCCSLGSATNPQGGIQNLFQYADEVNWTRGRHQVFAGLEVDRDQFNGTWTLYNGGTYTFNGQFTGNHAPGSGQKLGSGFADFLLGFPSSASGGIGLPSGAFRETDVGAYIQDNWKVTRKLTLNLGFRYQYFQPTYDKYHKDAITDLQTNTVHQGSWDASGLRVGPRVGLAYALNDKTVIRTGFGIYYNQQPYNFLQFAIANSPVYILQNVTVPVGTPVAVTDVFSANPGKSAQSPFTLGLHSPQPYIEQWNFGIQRSLWGSALATISYVGNESHHQPLRLNPNQAVQDTNLAVPTPLANRRPYPFIGDVFGQYNIQNTNYHSLQASLRYRWKSGLSFTGNYTYAKAMDIADTGAALPSNGLDAKGSSYGPANFDRTHVFTATYSYELPVGPGKRFFSGTNWVEREVIGGWQITGITRAETGVPFEITAADLSNTGTMHTQVADRVCDGNLPSSKRSIYHWFDTSCFVQPAAGRLGNSGRDILRGPGDLTFDLSTFKRFALKENSWIQLRADFLSAFNHPNFQTGNQATTSSTYGQLTGSTGARVIQTSLQFVF